MLSAGHLATRHSSIQPFANNAADVDKRSSTLQVADVLGLVSKLDCKQAQQSYFATMAIENRPLERLDYGNSDGFARGRPFAAKKSRKAFRP